MKLTLVKKQDEAQGTKSFFFEPEKEVRYIAGQYFYITLPKLNYQDPRGSTRDFTLSSSPSEGKNLRITTRIRQESGFKKTLDELAIRSIVEGEGPNGTFIFDENNKGPQVFLAGGIGITPFRSIIKYVFDKKLDTQIHLIYSNSVPEQIAFRKELTDISNFNQNIKVSMTVTKPEESKERWTGLVGRMDELMLKKLIENWSLKMNNPHLGRNLIFWLCGPPPMVDAMEQILSKLNISPDHIRVEKFTGY